ncbi:MULTISPECIES: arylformamidase [unclassified Bacillus (in: firmicutes)]|uniref:arylformamidase n=1 Tax=unclassified Bacillus (in: firmicutes) TaxID=185979 RepID=UPI0008E240FC|nr:MULTISPECIES: arylformamidase [unclassified Bacillus (in: firmicutes)]SFB13951.1 Kynurenine formamidase [Bacillus sp. UNCCL13]SFQ89853.1 Kynurenine formamidase [Bacillus sp. cl95]
MTSKWIDISQPLDHKVATWPGDTPFHYKVSWSMEESGSVNVGQVTMSTHTGTHIDAPFHFDNEGKRVIDLDVNLYIGPAKVIHLNDVTSIRVADLEKLDLQNVTRLLIRTGAWQNRSIFPAEIPPVESGVAEFLGKMGIRLLGLDLPSVDELDSKELPAHHELASNGLHILEGLVLDEIEVGDYELVALPLPLVEGDGSPVRAVLRKI